MPKPRGMSTKKELGQMLADWREAHWRLAGMKPILPPLPIYEGTHAQLTALSHSLGEVMLKLESHILDVCDGRVPRWMAIPKLVFQVERLNLVQAPAKASKRFPDMVRLRATCGEFPAADQARLVEWFASHPGQELVAHWAFKDLRAFVHVPGQPGRRLRFYQSGLAVAPPPGVDLVVQDHRSVIRGARNDAFSDPMAQSSRGWRVFVPRESKKPRQ